MKPNPDPPITITADRKNDPPAASAAAPKTETLEEFVRTLKAPRLDSESDDVFAKPPHTALLCDNDHFDGKWNRIKPDIYRHDSLVYSDKQGMVNLFELNLY